MGTGRAQCPSQNFSMRTGTHIHLFYAILNDYNVNQQQGHLSSETLQPVAAAGGEADGACATAPTVPGRQSVILFCYVKHKFFVFHSTILHTNRGQFLALMAPEGRILKANFQKFSGGNTPDTPLRATPFRTYRQYNLLLCAGLKPPSAGTQTIVPMVPNLCPSKNNLLAPPLLGARSPWSLYFCLPSLFSTLHYRPLLTFPSLPLLLKVGTL